MSDALARRTDPVESHEAAQHVDTETLSDRVLLALAIGPMTTHQIAEFLRLSLVTVSPRIAPLRRRNKVRHSGRTNAGRTIWELVPCVTP